MRDLDPTEGSSPDDTASRGDATLDEIILSYLASGDRGPEIRREWIGRYPGHAAALAEFFQGEGVFPSLERGDSPEDTLSFLTPAVPVRTGTIFGPYLIVDVLGKGGMGVVYRAWQGSPRRFVALKMISGGFRHSSPEARRFRAEADAIAKLDDPGIVTIHEVGEVNGRAYFTMDLIAGRSLDHHLGRFRGDLRASAGLVALAARAVHHAHLRGLLHRDLKPSNILLGQNDRPIVSDFGLARRIDGDSDLTETGAILGSPRYMAPESIDLGSGSITTAVDVYGLGAILYALLTGEPPFGGKNPAETLEQVRHQAPRAPRSINPAVPRDLETVCLKCLAKSPGGRYPSAEALAEDLDRWASGRPILGRRVGLAERLVGWSRRRPAQAAMASALVAAIVLGMGGIIWQWRRAVAAREALEESLYASLITLADRELNTGEIGLARTLLERCQPARRGWEWLYLRANRPLSTTRAAQAGSVVFDMAYGPRGESFALLEMSNDAASIRMIDRKAGRDAWTWPVHRTAEAKVAFDPTGRKVATASSWGEVAVLDAATGRPAWTFMPKPRAACWSLAFSPDGETLAVGQKGTIDLLDAATGASAGKLEGHKDRVYALSFRRDGARLASAGDDGTAIVWDLASRLAILTIPEGSLLPIKALSYNPSGDRLVGGTDFGTVATWDAATGRELSRSRGHGGKIKRISFDRSGRRFASGSVDGLIKIWDAASGDELLAIPDSDRVLAGLDFSPDGTELASAGRTLHIREAPPPDRVSPGRLTFLGGHEGLTTGVAYSPDGSRMATASHDRTVLIRDGRTGGVLSRLAGHSGALECLAFRPDGREIASGGWDRTVRVWDLATGRARLVLEGHQRSVSAIAYAPKGDVLATAGYDGWVWFWDATTGAKLGMIRHAGFVYDLDFSPDGTRLAIAVGDGTARIIDVATRRQEFQFKAPFLRVSAVCFSPDGRDLGVAAQESVTILDIQTEQPVLRLDGLDSDIRSLAYSPDGRWLATGSDHRTVTLWDAGTGRKIDSRDEAIARVGRVRFAPDGRKLAATAGDETILFWDLADLATGPSRAR